MRNKIKFICIMLIFCFVFTNLIVQTKSVSPFLDKKSQTMAFDFEDLLTTLKNKIKGVIQNGTVTIVGLTEEQETLYRERQSRLPYGKYIYEAKEVEGFEVIGESSKEVTLSKKK